MEVGARRGAHFQLVRRGGTQSPITWRNPMKPRLILLFTLDRTFDQFVREAFSLVEVWIEEECAKNGGRLPESVEVLPI